MNDSRNEIRELWCRQLSGEQLNGHESQRLQNALREDSDLQFELSGDATSHALLSSLEDVAQTKDKFVQAVMQQINADQAAPLDSANTMATSVIESPGLPMVADARRSDNRRENKRQRSQLWLSFAVTLVLFVSLGLFFWSQSQRQQNVAETERSPNKSDVEQKSVRPLQVDQPTVDDDHNVAVADDVNPNGSHPAEDADDSPPRVAVNDNETTPSTPDDDLASSEAPNMSEETRPDIASQSFATLTRIENPVWEREDTVGARLRNEVVRLFGGTIELTFDDGAIVTLEGPVEFQPLTASLLELRRGHLSATVPKPAIGFKVITPTAEVVDLGTEFDVSVKDTGASDVVIRKGEIEVAPGGRNSKNIQKWKLVPGGLNHASFYARPGNDQSGPIVAKAQGARGQFRGVISIDGKTAKFRSENTFNNVHQRVLTHLKNSQDTIQPQWQDFVDSMQQKMRGTMNFNGRQMQFGNLDEVMRLHNQLQSQLNIRAGTPFNGSIDINGKVIQFQTREEFEAARRAAFGPAANFGAGDIFERQAGPE